MDKEQNDENNVIQLADYAKEQHEQIVQELAIRKAKGADIDAREVAGLVYSDKDTKTVSKWLVDNDVCSQREWNKLMHKERIKKALGGYPNTALQLVEIFAAKHRIKFHYSHLERYVVQECEGTVITDEMRQENGEYDYYCRLNYDIKMNEEQFCREIRMMNSDHELGFDRADIADAVATWCERAALELKRDVFIDINGNFPKDEEWLRLAKAAFQDGGDFHVAVLQKFIWQVKRKMIGLPVTNHLMPVLLGPQGKGKSTFMNLFVSPAKEVTLPNADFQQIEDIRNIDMWRNYVMMLDEMGYASKSNVDSVKNIITAETLQRRPMGTNRIVSIAQNATFIGCSNKELSQLIRDETGLRRFVPLQFSNSPDHAVINAMDWLALWRSVNYESADPMKAFLQELAELQEEDREQTPVETWASLDATKNQFTNWTSGFKMFEDFNEWQQRFFPGQRNTFNITSWGNEMKRLIGTGKFEYEKARRSTGVFYRFFG